MEGNLKISFKLIFSYDNHIRCVYLGGSLLRSSIARVNETNRVWRCNMRKSIFATILNFVLRRFCEYLFETYCTVNIHGILTIEIIKRIRFFSVLENKTFFMFQSCKAGWESLTWFMVKGKFTGFDIFHVGFGQRPLIFFYGHILSSTGWIPRADGIVNVGLSRRNNDENG